MRIPPNTGLGAVRFSLGRTTSEEEIEAVMQGLTECLA
jgi:cysteine sulfinate desulfinase/cysteine desulfurase-like protein